MKIINLSEITWLETVLSIFNLHVIMVSALNGTVRKTATILLAFFMVPFLALTFFDQLLVGQIAISLTIPVTLVIPYITIKGVHKIQALYISILYLGFSIALILPSVWAASALKANQTVIIILDIAVNLAITIWIQFLRKTGKLSILAKHFSLLNRSIKFLLVITVWCCALLAFLLSELFYGFPDLPNLVLAELIAATLIIIVGIMCPLVITNNISSVYHKILLRATKKQMKQQVNHYERMIQAQEMERTFIHDFKNLKIGLIAHLNNSDIVGALHYLNECDKPYMAKYIYFETGSPILDALLSEKQIEASKINTTILFEGTIPNQLIEPIDICIMFGNALDNALEACTYNTQDEQKVISISTYFNNHFLFITIKNPIKECIIIENNHVSTTKKDRANHGLGLYSVQDAIEKYNGSYRLLVKEQTFILDMCLDFNPLI